MGDILNNLVFSKLKNNHFILFVSIILFLIAIWFIVPKISYDIELYNIKLDLLIRILFTIIILILLPMIFYNRIKKNKTNLLGIGIYIDSSILTKDDVRKNLFFSSLKNKMKAEYEVIVYEKNSLDKYLKKQSKVDTMKELNLNIMFDVSERIGTKNNKDIYELKITHTYVRFPTYIDINFINHFVVDLTNSINFCLEITGDNNLNEVDQEVSLFELGIDYINSIILSVSNNPEKGFPILDKLSAILRVTNINKNNVKYIKNNIIYRYIDLYYNIILKILSTEPYYSDAYIFEKLKMYYNNYENMIINNKDIINKKLYKYLINDMILVKSIIYKYDLTITPNNGALFSKAFLLGCDSKYYKSYLIYKKLSKRRDINEFQLINIIEFIEIRFNNDENNVNLKFCLALVNYYFKDEIIAKKYFDEIKNKNEEIKKVYHELLEVKND